MVAKIFYEFAYSRIITNVFLVFVLVGKNLIIPFFPLYLKYLRLSSLEAGIVISVQYLCEMLVSPVWVFVVRRSHDSHKKRALVVLSLILTSAIYVCLVFVPPAGQPSDVTHCLKNNPISSTVLPVTTSTVNTTTSSTTSTTSSTTEAPTTSSTASSTTIFNIIRTELPQTADLNEQDDNEYPQYGDPLEENQPIDDQIKRKPSVFDWNLPIYNYEDRWSSRKLNSIDFELVKDTHWFYSSVFRAAFVLSFFSAILNCIAEPAVSSLWAQRLDDAEHLEQRGEHVIWSRFVSSIIIILLSLIMTFLAPCYIARGLHQIVVHPLTAAGTLLGAAIIALFLLPLQSGKLSTIPVISKTRAAAPASGLKMVLRGISTMISGAAVTSGTLFLMWHVSTLQPADFKYNYEIIFGGFVALEMLCSVPVLGWSRSPASQANISPGRAALGLMVLGLQFGLTPLLKIPAPLPLLGALQGAGGALLERSIGRAHSSSSWKFGCAIAAVGSGITYHIADVRVTMWGAGTLALVAALSVLITGRNVPSKRRRRAYSRLLLAETPSSSSTQAGTIVDENISESDEAESDWFERALRAEDINNSRIS